ncbi:hypothetical protein JAAARDRAFT_57771 [Jaapia argillacea MUCL 33604]|uniref:Uncharacterized protein n=1 Tax=Jaapia argillacea MUCL 33604 TaxID=933084 RepID=A0A067Q3B0_9AGAM|nr:hypothetical protein JAAARDRAFT_57771 [Jaapia argillacea MUCL 33604]
MSRTPELPQSDLFYREFPSARRHKIAGKIAVGQLLRWMQSPDATSDITGRQICDIAWMKDPGLPAHEFLSISISYLPFDLRFERDTDSWITLFLPKSRSNCKDTVTIIPHPADFSGSFKLAEVSFLHSRGPALQDLSDLLDIIAESADFYNVWTLNCWWFACSIWTNLVRRGLVCYSWCSDDMAGQWRSFSGEDGEDLGTDPMKVARMLQFVHVAGLQRTMGDSEGPEALARVSARIASALDRRANRSDHNRTRLTLLSRMPVSSTTQVPDFHQDFPSARYHTLLAEPIPVQEFLLWALSQEALWEVTHTRIMCIEWVEQPQELADNCLLVTLVSSGSWLFRVEHRANPCLPLSRPDCMVAIIPVPDNQPSATMARVCFHATQGPTVRDLADILDVISRSTTLNSRSWCASCIWANLVALGTVASSWCRRDIIRYWENVTQEDAKCLGWYPIMIWHAVELNREIGMPWGEMERISEEITTALQLRRQTGTVRLPSGARHPYKHASP